MLSHDGLICVQTAVAHGACSMATWAQVGCLSCAAGRLLAGWGAGAASLYVPRYLAEIAPPAIRGFLGSLSQVCPMGWAAGVSSMHCNACSMLLGKAGHAWALSGAPVYLPALL